MMAGGPSGNFIGQFSGYGGYVYDVFDSGWVRIVTSPISDSNAWVDPASSKGIAILSELKSRYPAVRDGLAGAKASGAAAGGPSAPGVRGVGGGPSGPGGANAWSTVKQATDTFGPLLVDLVTGLAGGGRNSGVDLAGQLAKKRAQLATERNPVQRAKLEAEIDALSMQLGQYNKLTSSVVNSNAAAGAGVDLGADYSTESSWLPWVIGGGVLVVGLALVSGSK